MGCVIMISGVTKCMEEDKKEKIQYVHILYSNTTKQILAAYSNHEAAEEAQQDIKSYDKDNDIEVITRRLYG